MRWATRLPVAAVVIWAGLAMPAAAQRDDIEALVQRYPVVEEDGRRVVELSLAEALELVLERSITLRATRLNEQIALSGLTSARGRNYPSLTNSVSQDRSVSAIPSFGIGTRTDTTSYSAELTKKLSSGIELSAGVLQQRQKAESFALSGSDADAGGSSPAFERTQVVAGVAVPLFQDFGSDVNDLPERFAEVGLSTSRNDSRQTALDLLRAVASTYWDLVGLRESIRVRQEAVALSEQLLRDNRERLRAGVVSPADVKVSESQLANDRQALLNTRVDAQRIEDEVRAALNLEGLELGLRPVEGPKLRQGPFDMAPLLEKSLSRDPRVANVDAALQRNTYELVEATNRDEADLDLNLEYRLNGFGSDSGESTTDISDPDRAGYNLSVTWTVPLFDQVTPEAIRQRRLDRTRLQLTRDNLQSEITVQLQAIRRLLRLGEEEVETAQVSVALQEELLQNEIERFRLGESTSFQVAEVQQDFSQAREREILARIRYEKIFLELLLVTGDIYAQYGLPEDLP